MTILEIKQKMQNQLIIFYIIDGIKTAVPEGTAVDPQI